jgi:peptidoglycan lytic transglycosylase
LSLIAYATFSRFYQLPFTLASEIKNFLGGLMLKSAGASRARAGLCGPCSFRALGRRDIPTVRRLAVVLAVLLIGAGSGFNQARAVEGVSRAETVGSSVQENTPLASPLDASALPVEGNAISDLNLLNTVDVLVGGASMYNPCEAADRDAGSIETASGEPYDPAGWTAAIQINLRGAFGGIQYGRNYRPAFALVESGGKRAIVKINDVGPLRPGRVIDFSQQTMRYFDPSLQAGIIDGVTVAPLIGSNWTPGPLGTRSVVTLTSNTE